MALTRFGLDLSQVKVHTDAAAGRTALDIGANAFTVGRDIAFAPGRFSPNTPSERQLIAHEIAHTVQSLATAPPLL